MPEALGQSGPRPENAPSSAGNALQSAHKGATAAVTEGWINGGAFFGSIMAGTLLGLAADQWLNTSPWLVVIGIIAGSGSGFYRLWMVGRTPTGRQPLGS
ncbi:MAG: AtpZ/AtpI family protein [Acidimicrobiia bacterium]|nr:AtpZ/AtpI family protein [Acidimicrobiia bacterium]